MKKIIVLALAIAGFQANAAKYQSCVDAVTNKCGRIAALDAIYSTSGNSCSIVQNGTREDGSKFDTRVVFKDSYTLYSIELNSRCDDSVKIDLSSPVVEDKQFAGRLFSLTADGQIIAIGRDNGPAMLLNAKGKPYSNVVDMKISEEGMELTFADGNRNTIDTAKMLQKINLQEAKIPTYSIY